MTEKEVAMQRYAIRISKNLRLLMANERIIKNRELSKKSGVSEVTISSIKNDYKGELRPGFTTLVLLADGLDVDVAELLREA
ncbi:helix-turn-helix transcriptional regulator [Enterococcus pseudoavium]|uniref:Helix-turn-helix transcriptional regulator n=2 Tax=Enterococcus TaxID=1350 RepID=A0AAE4L4T2_9ENTE|nr:MULTISPECIES: helix-turn-helix transcriptional regulator [Enterococcus]MDT2597100.1 helix-turn-helix transcriptional regulator [Enterococcus dongliensis]MDT2613970.1 helix-turn-helix transcriptional regulator [Enterococcus dongliensis]MDT2634977.1 helix-turn-helix transcriptional regulator [Enterococcus dongliensis]MDT2636215.1 helix-turn-helix transcriptional regulator [Enterococcus dongliensis]MDT2643026.1 helix-turn-helix transcriptional regulator [Enterococcus dongliensis]